MNTVNTPVVVRTSGLGKKYGSSWALKDCSIAVEEGSITALVGPNGAGKSTLMQIIAGLNAATVGEVQVFDKLVKQNATLSMPEIGFLAQEVPLYKDLSIKDYLRAGAGLNIRWNQDQMRKHLEELNLPFDKPVGKLSGGQRAQVALAVALAKEPRLLILDEPVAALDPLARRDFLSSLAKAAASDDGPTVIMSSHLLEDLERLCDNLIIMNNGFVELCESIETALKTHRRLVGSSKNQLPVANSLRIIDEKRTERQLTLFVKTSDIKSLNKNDWQIMEPTIEDIVLAYMENKAPIDSKTISGGEL